MVGFRFLTGERGVGFHCWPGRAPELRLSEVGSSREWFLCIPRPVCSSSSKSEIRKETHQPFVQMTHPERGMVGLGM
jgi:hypothetical protein